MKIAPWIEGMAAAMLVIPPILIFWYFYSVNAVMVAEVVPQDNGKIPLPKTGDRVQVYGEWIRDEGHVFGQWYNWYEIHPVRYLKNLDTGAAGGKQPYGGPLGEGAWNKQWLMPIDPQNPFREMKGTVVETFHNEEDGDVHIHILPDREYQDLARYPATMFRLGIAPLLEFYGLNLEQTVALVAGPPLTVWVLYAVMLARYPSETILGRWRERRKK